MTTPRTVVTGIATVLAAAAILVAVWLFAIAPKLDGDDPAASPGADPAGTAMLAPDATAPTPVDPVGQAADDGDFEPLRVPAGLTTGVGATVPDEQRTPPGTEAVAGVAEPVIVNAYQPDTSTDPYLLVSVDDVSAPFAGTDRDAAFVHAGQESWPERSVQEITMRIRQVAGHGDISSWDLHRAVVPVNSALEGMTVAAAEGSDCSGGRHPLDGHDASTNDTVQVCLYAFGTIARPSDPVSSVSLSTRVGGATPWLYFQSNWDSLPDPGHHHEGDGETLHEHEHEHEHE